MNRSKTFVEDGAWLYKGFCFFFFAVLAIKKLSLSFIACAIDETNPVVKSICETVPKSLFCASTCVLGFEDAP